MVTWDFTRVWSRVFFPPRSPPPQGHRFSFILRRLLFTRGDQTGERRAWSISWYQLRRCPPCNISGKRRKKWLEVFAGMCGEHTLSRRVCIIVVIRHMFGAHAHSDGAEATCSISSVIVYMTPLAVGCGHQLPVNIGTISRLINVGHLA